MFFVVWNLRTMLLAVQRAQAKEIMFAQKLRDNLPKIIGKFEKSVLNSCRAQ